MCGCRRGGGGGSAAAPDIPVINGVPLQTRSVTTTTTYTQTMSGRALRRAGGVAPTYTQTTTTSVPLDVIDTAIWGPSMWRVLHVLSLLAPAAAWEGVPTALDGALPCPECRTHYHEWVAAQPIDTSIATGPRDWVAALHNAVNDRLSRPSWTMDEVLAAYGPLTKADAVAALAVVRDMIGSVGLAALDALIAATP